MTEVRISSLAKAFGGTRAVDGISLTVGHGEFVSLLGPSGCGKTTTLKIIAGFEDPDAGAIAFDGRDVVATPAEKRDIGMVFQSYALFPHMTIAGNLAFGLEMRRLPKGQMTRRIDDVLDMVQLKGLENRYPRELSGGQQQRVALARALVIEPSILLLDEPLANLDAKLREDMRGFIRNLQKRVGITTIYVTHDQAEAIAMSDRIAVMFGGRVAQIGAPTDIYERPASLEVARFVGQANIVEGRSVRGLDGGFVATTSIGEVAFAAAGKVPADRPVLLLLRPEAVQMRPAPDDATAAAKITSVLYSGAIIDYHLELGDGTPLHVQTMPSMRFAIGDRVLLEAPAGGWHVGAAQ